MMKFPSNVTVVLAIISFSLPACNVQKEVVHSKPPRVVTSRIQAKSVVLTHQYVCQIRAKRHIQMRAFETGYVEAIAVKEGQKVKEGDVLLRVAPLAHQAKQDLQIAEQNLAQLELNEIRKKSQDQSNPENKALVAAKLASAQARVSLATAQVTTAAMKAPFDGVVDRLSFQGGSRVEKGEILATLSDSSRIRVDFNVSEVRYLEYMADKSHRIDDLQVELILASGEKYDHAGKVGEMDADFNGPTGTICIHADFPNPEGRLRHGQMGTVLVGREVKDAIVIPQQAALEVLSQRYVYVVDRDDVVHRRDIVIQNEFEDTFVIQRGLSTDDRIVVEGIRRVRDGEKVECEDRDTKRG